MKKIAFIYGGTAGFIIIVVMIAGLMLKGSEHFLGSQAFGYLIMLIALSLIYFGIRKYRDTEMGGTITFWPAAGLGISIAAIASVMYVAIWEVNLAQTDYAFIDEYTTSIIKANEAKGVSGDELAELKSEMDAMKQQYANPLFRIPMTFSEVFPVGLIVSLLSAFLLSRRKKE